VLLASNWSDKTKRPKPYPRPTDPPPAKFGDAAGRTVDEVLAIFEAHGHGPAKWSQPRDARGRFTRPAS
jgi:hypothetical protein